MLYNMSIDMMLRIQDIFQLRLNITLLISVLEMQD